MASNFNWNLCIFCQNYERAKKLVHPSKSTHDGNGFETLSVDIEYAISKGVDGKYFSYLNDGSGIAETLLKNDAAYHRPCRNMYYKSKIDRSPNDHPNKRKTEESPITRGNSSAKRRNIKIDE